jgi:hypothetical protein
MSEQKTVVQPPQPSERKPNEVSGFHFSTAIKITDPVTKQVLLQRRAD